MSLRDDYDRLLDDATDAEIAKLVKGPNPWPELCWFAFVTGLLVGGLVVGVAK